VNAVYNNQVERAGALKVRILESHRGTTAQRRYSDDNRVSTSDGNPEPELTPSRDTGRFERVVLRLFARSVKVSGLQVLANRFRLITLAGEALKQAVWTPGQKVQVRLGGFVARTYTPISWDRSAGSTRLLVFIHGDAPGAAWAAALKRGDACQIFGPGRSRDLTTLRRPAVFFGDETSMGLAHALHATENGTQDIAFVFEVSSIAESQQVLQTLGLPGATLLERAQDGGHLDEAGALITRTAAERSPQPYILSGNARSIQSLTRSLKRSGIPSSRLQVKPYWAPGKTGLD
jgi:ferric-chelate reductase (NADPH)